MDHSTAEHHTAAALGLPTDILFPEGGFRLSEALEISGLALPFDPDLAVQLEIDAHDFGHSRGVRFRLAELAQEILDAAGYSVSPCGIHLFPRPVARCARCGR